jgi:5-methylcytosine-specific restriction enzyme A
MTRLPGKRLNSELALGAEHARYHKDGYWYDQLQKFPGVLFDFHGYVSFTSQNAYQHCPQLRHPDRDRSDGRPGTLSVPAGISSIPGYIRDNRIAALDR